MLGRQDSANLSKGAEPVSLALTYVCSNIQDNIAIVDPDAFLQVALLINDLMIDKHGLCF